MGVPHLVANQTRYIEIRVQSAGKSAAGRGLRGTNPLYLKTLQDGVGGRTALGHTQSPVGYTTPQHSVAGFAPYPAF
jgi:hypothetical protein